MATTFPLRAIRVETTQFQFAHGKKPSGQGSWAFSIEGHEFWFHRAKFSEAVALAKRQAQQMGATVVSVCS
jgi:hypothetical protein